MNLFVIQERPFDQIGPDNAKNIYVTNNYLKAIEVIQERYEREAFRYILKMARGTKAVKGLNDKTRQDLRDIIEEIQVNSEFDVTRGYAILRMNPYEGVTYWIEKVPGDIQ